MNVLYTAIVMLATTPTPQPNFNENSVTPTWVGFAATFGVAAIVVLLCIDMVRRVRRVRYRGEIREQLEAERDAAEREPAERDAAERDAAAEKPRTD
ncbi:hypothetical protein [Glaciihabitans sp. GrIS 2.15]|uniref:hypothetical protein n=1 Tax=Glaciihabitans sp. GrIS 2.15 TaxID=3071710 RepID=UPI0019A4C5DC|nr:hypothetical protein [Microbacteriaceae bacterium]MEC5168664.1 Ni/Fe-hydrogenase subunit HybB-like protein [Glaciihabitans sp. GrIS 2.15]